MAEVIEAPADTEEKRIINMVTGTITVAPQTMLAFNCWEIEVPILQELHGESNVIAEKEDTLEIEKYPPDQIYDQLIRKYARNNEQNPVLAVYGNNPMALAKAMGEKYKVGSGYSPKAANGSVMRIGGKEVV